jgi:hypothetical protein
MTRLALALVAALALASPASAQVRTGKGGLYMLMNGFDDDDFQRLTGEMTVFWHRTQRMAIYRCELRKRLF